MKVPSRKMPEGIFFTPSPSKIFATKARRIKKIGIQCVGVSLQQWILKRRKDLCFCGKITLSYKTSIVNYCLPKS